MSLYLFSNELRLQWYEMRQYWFETITGLFFISAVFIGLFYGIKGFVIQQDDSSSLDGLLIGFIMWSFASSAYGSVTKSLIEDTQKGYLEQLFLCPKGFVTLILCRSFIETTVGIITVTLLAYIAMFFTGNWLSINLFSFYGVLLLAAPSLVGFGLMVSGLALIFKRVETIGAMLSLGLMGLVALDGLPFNLFTLLPFVAGSSLARSLVFTDQGIDISSVLIVMTNSGVYLALGISFFKLCEHQAKKRNLIGQY